MAAKRGRKTAEVVEVKEDPQPAEQLAHASDPADPGYARMIFLPRQTAGVKVTEETALTYSPVWACVRVISEDLATLPLRVHDSLPNGGNRIDDNNPVDWLLHTQANPETTSFIWREVMTAWTLTWGNAYAEIERDGAGNPYWLWQITPDRVYPDRDARGNLYYDVCNPGESNVAIPAEDMIHFKGLGFDGLVGYSVVSMAARSIGSGIAADEYSSAYYNNDATPGGLLKLPGRLTDPARQRLQEDWIRMHGGPRNRRKIAVLENGLDYMAIGTPAGDAQLLETRQFGPTEIARWFRVPPHKIADLTHATYSNIEEQERGYVNDCLIAWASRQEQELNVKLFGRNNRRRKFVKHNLNGRLRGNTQARATLYREMFDRGVYSVNDILELEDRNPIGPDGDKRFVPLNMQLLEKAGEDMGETEKEVPADSGSEDKEPGPEEHMMAWRMVLVDTCDRIVRRAHHRWADATKKQSAPTSAMLEEHRGYARDALRPVLQAMAIAHGLTVETIVPILLEVATCKDKPESVVADDWANLLVAQFQTAMELQRTKL